MPFIMFAFQMQPIRKSDNFFPSYLSENVDIVPPPFPPLQNHGTDLPLRHDWYKEQLSLTWIWYFVATFMIGKKILTFSHFTAIWFPSNNLRGISQKITPYPHNARWHRNYWIVFVKCLSIVRSDVYMIWNSIY